MRVLNDFVGIDLTEDQLLPIARELLPRLLTIVGMAEVCSFLPLLFQVIDPFRIDVLRLDSSSSHPHLSTVCDDAIHGQGRISCSCQSCCRRHSPDVDRSVQNLTSKRPGKGARGRVGLGRSRHPRGHLQCAPLLLLVAQTLILTDRNVHRSRSRS